MIEARMHDSRTTAGAQPFSHWHDVSNLLCGRLIAPGPAGDFESGLTVGQADLALVNVFAQSIEHNPAVEKIIQVEIMKYAEARSGVDVAEDARMEPIVVANVEDDRVALLLELMRGNFLP
jgi:hypothetical protein